MQFSQSRVHPSIVLSRSTTAFGNIDKYILNDGNSWFLEQGITKNPLLDLLCGFHTCASSLSTIMTSLEIVLSDLLMRDFLNEAVKDNEKGLSLGI